MSNNFNTITVLDYCCNEVRVYRNVDTDDPEQWLEEHDENWDDSQCSYMYGKDTEVTYHEQDSES